MYQLDFPKSKLWSIEKFINQIICKILEYLQLENIIGKNKDHKTSHFIHEVKHILLLQLLSPSYWIVLNFLTPIHYICSDGRSEWVSKLVCSPLYSRQYF